ncbi:hypothetical protein P1X14_07205 [Sphingomonas sp. AOB5]|uniref:hypothetical protein n=1 Tax=Sphingomonas sp. AOB5 TaxID=3034017 RepID=UPI0023F8B2DC|nr:hypothetical protein [Sphingomonas sp. AOB5]MDF7775027.1 hypothetical protein [Sphingomonas sp. AOB5]
MRFWLAAALLLPVSAHAQAGWDLQRVHREVAAIAFDPARFFETDSEFRDLIRIRYVGDDRNWPVYSIVIRDACNGRPAEQCSQGRIARMVRAPVPPQGAERPRWRGSALVIGLTGKGIRSRSDLVNALDGARLDWVEADLTTCPGAMAQLAKARDAQWVLPELVSPQPADSIELVIHADTVRVEFRSHLRRSIYDGRIAEKSPGQWAAELARTLEPCWKPASAPPPWRLPPKAVD